MAVPTQYPRIKPIQPSSRMIFFVKATAEVPSRPVCNRDLRTSSGVQMAPDATVTSEASPCSPVTQAGQRSYPRSAHIAILPWRSKDSRSAAVPAATKIGNCCKMPISRSLGRKCSLKYRFEAVCGGARG